MFAMQFHRKCSDQPVRSKGVRICHEQALQGLDACIARMSVGLQARSHTIIH